MNWQSNLGAIAQYLMTMWPQITLSCEFETENSREATNLAECSRKLRSSMSNTPFEGNEESSFQKGAVDVGQNVLPEKFKLYPAYPNPFNPITTLKFDVPKSVHVIPISLSIFDITGRKVETLISEKKSHGTVRTQWNAFGHSSGVYFPVISLRT